MTQTCAFLCMRADTVAHTVGRRGLAGSPDRSHFRDWSWGKAMRKVVWLLLWSAVLP